MPQEWWPLLVISIDLCALIISTLTARLWISYNVYEHSKVNHMDSSMLHFALFGRYMIVRAIEYRYNTIIPTAVYFTAIWFPTSPWSCQYPCGCMGYFCKNIHTCKILHRLLRKNVCTTCLITFDMLQTQEVNHFLAYFEADIVLVKWPSGNMSERLLPTIQSVCAVPASKDISTSIK